MAASSVTDARTIVTVERLLQNGYVVRSHTADGQFVITVAGGGQEGVGAGDTFPEALYNALADMRSIPQVA